MKILLAVVRAACKLACSLACNLQMCMVASKCQRKQL